MKLLLISCLVVLVAVVYSEKCRDKDPLTCTIQCPLNQVHSCRDDRCFCRTGEHCLSVSDCHNHCHGDYHSHCLDGECHCLKLDGVDNNND